MANTDEYISESEPDVDSNYTFASMPNSSA